MTYGQLISYVQKTTLEICQNDKLQRQLAKEKSQSRKELGTFCEQFGIPRCSTKKTRKVVKQEQFPSTRLKNSKLKFRRSRKPFQSKESKTQTRPPTTKSIICYNYRKPGHTSKYCRLKRKLSNLNLEPELEEKINNFLVETSEEESDPELSEENLNEIQEDEQESSSDNENIPTVNVLTKEQDLLFEVINSIPDPNEKRTYLNKLKQTLEQTS